MSEIRDFKNKVIIITGSSSGIGEGIAIYLSKLGAQVVVTGRNAVEINRVSKICESVSPKLLKPLEVVADITNDDEAKHLINNTISTFGKLDVLVNSAGAIQMASIHDKDLMEKYEKTMRLNLRSVVKLSHLSIPHLEKTKGNIVNISGIGSQLATPQFSAYCMSKAGLDMLTKCLAIEMGPKGVRVNSVNPGPVPTKLLMGMGLDAKTSEILFDNMGKMTCVGFVGRPQDIASAVGFLASSDANFITGTIMVVDGGAMYSTTKPDFNK